MTTCSKCSKCLQGHPRRQIKRQSSGGKGSWSENRGQRSGLADAAAAEVEESDCLTQTGTQALRVTTGARLLSSSASPCFCSHAFLGHTTPISIHFCMKWWQRQFWALGEPLLLNPTHRRACPKHSITTVHWGHILRIFHQKLFKKPMDNQASKQTTHHTPTQNVFIVRNLLFLYKDWTLPHAKHFCMFTTPATHFRGGWGLYITTLTRGMGSKQSTTHIFPWAALILKAGTWTTTAQPWQHLFSGWNKGKPAFKVISPFPTCPIRLQPFLSWQVVQKSFCSHNRARWWRAWHGDNRHTKESLLCTGSGGHGQRLQGQESQEWLGEVWHKGLFKTLMP